MKKFLYWASRAFLLFIFAFVVLSFAQTDLLPRVVEDFVLLYGFIGLPIAIVVLISTTPTRSIGVMIWKFLLAISLTIIAIPFLFVLNPFYHDIQKGDPSGFLLIPVVFFGAPLLFIEIAGLLVAEALATSRTRR